jgi:hypothetical protein
MTKLTSFPDEEIKTYRSTLDGMKVRGKLCPPPIKNWYPQRSPCHALLAATLHSHSHLSALSSPFIIPFSTSISRNVFALLIFFCIFLCLRMSGTAGAGFSADSRTGAWQSSRSWAGKSPPPYSARSRAALHTVPHDSTPTSRGLPSAVQVVVQTTPGADHAI